MSAVDPSDQRHQQAGQEPSRPSWQALVEAQPGAAFVIDALGTITWATEQAAVLVERRVDELVGTSVLDHVDPDAVWAYAAALDFAAATTFAPVASGPVRVRIRTSSGGWATADLWTTNRTEDPEVAGIVCLLTPPTAALGLADAATAAAAGASFDQVATVVASALGDFPIIGRVAVLEAAPDGFAVVALHQLARSLVDGTCGDDLWRAAHEQGSRIARIGTSALPDALVDVAAAAGLTSVWVEPVPVLDHPGEVRHLVVVFRSLDSDPTPNELSYLHRAAAVLGLAASRHVER